MSFEERGVWILLTVAVAAYAVYLFLILGGPADVPLAERPYVVPMLWTIGGAIVGGIVLSIFSGILTGIISRRGTVDKKDQRDKEIGAFGTRMGQAWIVIGALAAMLMAMAEWDWFWIANVLYLCFAVSAIFEGVAKVVAYRRGLPQW